jgi:predicted transcriptional regulator
MRYAFCDGRKAVEGRYFTLPNELFHLGLTAGEIATYAYLLYCEDRKTYQCRPSFTKIGGAIRKTKNTVKKYVDGLRDKGLISTEQTKKTAKDGAVLNGNLLYTILPIENAVQMYNDAQMAAAEIERQRQLVLRRAKQCGVDIRAG